MRRVLTVFISLVLAFGMSLVPFEKQMVYAEGGHPDITNLTIDENGIMTWDTVEGAHHYDIYYGDDIHNVGAYSEETRYDLYEAFRSSGIKSGDHVVRVVASPGDLAESSVTYHYVVDNQCPDPTGLYWDGYTLHWDDLGSEFSYTVWFYETYENGTTSFIKWAYADGNQCDISQIAAEKSIHYSVGVVAAHSDWADSNMIMSSSIAGRFTIQPLNLSISGDILSFGELIDDEGNAPGSYYVMIDNGSDYESFTSYEPTYNIREFLETNSLPEGYWGMYAYAYSQDGVRLNDTSNTVYYRYGNPDSYMVSFDANGGRGYIESVFVEKNTNYVVTDAEFTAPEGYVFSHWYTEEYGDVYASDSLPVNDGTGDIVLVAQWRKRDIEAVIIGDELQWEPYPDVTYYSVGVGVGDFEESSGSFHGGVISADTLSVDLWRYCAQYEMEAGTITVVLNALDQESRELADWWIGYYTYDPDGEDRALIIFDLNGQYGPEISMLHSIEALKGQRFSDINIENYYPEGNMPKVFDKWCYDPEGNNEVWLSDSINANTTLYARWKEPVDPVSVICEEITAGMSEGSYPYSEIQLVGADGNYSLDDAAWSLENGDTFEGAFEAGKTYYLVLNLMIENSDYLFPFDYAEDRATFTLLVNGQECEYISNGDPSYIFVRIPFAVETIEYPTPDITGVANTSAGVKLAWKKAKGALDYSVFREEYGNPESKVLIAVGVTGNKYTIPLDGLQSGTKYTYTVSARFSGNATESSLSRYYIGTTVMNAPTCTATGLRVTWPKVNGAEKYVIFRHAGSGPVEWKYLTTVPATEDAVQVYNNKGTFTPGGWYAYTVRAIGAENTYGGQPAGRSVRYRQPVQITKAESISSGVRITFTSVEAGYTYALYRADVTGGHTGSYTRVAVVTNASVNKSVWIKDATAENNKTYSYYVRCISKDLAVPLSSYANTVRITYKK